MPYTLYRGSLSALPLTNFPILQYTQSLYFIQHQLLFFFLSKIYLSLSSLSSFLLFSENKNKKKTFHFFHSILYTATLTKLYPRYSTYSILYTPYSLLSTLYTPILHTLYSISYTRCSLLPWVLKCRNLTQLRESIFGTQAHTRIIILYTPNSKPYTVYTFT